MGVGGTCARQPLTQNLQSAPDSAHIMNAPRPLDPPPPFADERLGPGWVYRSTHYPSEPFSGKVYSGFFARHFAVGAAVLAAVLVLRIGGGTASLMWIGIGGLAVALAVSWLTARVAMSHRIGAVRFQGNAVFVYTLEDLDLETPEVKPFPVSYTSPATSGGMLQMHFHDRVLTLRPEHWPYFREMAIHLDELRKEAV